VSPRRRLLLGSAGLLVAALVAVLVLRVVNPARRHPDTPPPQDRPGPVLLVPGYGGSRDALTVLAARIRATGRQAEVLALPGDGTGDLTLQAQVLQAAAAQALARGAPSVDVVGYSAGGVVARVWVAQHGGGATARRVITLGAPLHGTQLAAIGASLGTGACPPACQQLIPGSTLLADLDRTPLPAGLPWLSLWTANDETVTPPDSARLAGATNVELQSVCRDETVQHAGLPTDPLVTGIVLRALSAAPLAAPTAADCATLRREGSG
jgi:triacylglycerol lipase